MANPKGLSVEPTSGLPTVGQSPSGVDPAGEPANGAIESSAAPASVPAGPHFLESEWVMWEHRAPDKNSKSYEDNMAKLCEFATIEDFWRLWNNIPKPSAIFYDGRTKKKFKDRTVESFSLFKGLRLEQLHAAAEEAWDGPGLGATLRPEMADLVSCLRAAGWRVLIVTASPAEAVLRGAQALGVPEGDILAVRLEADASGVVTGRPSPVMPLTWREGKAAALDA